MSAAMSGNAFLPLGICGLGRNYVIRVTALATLYKTDLGEQAGVVPLSLMGDIDRKLNRVILLQGHSRTGIVQGTYHIW